MAKEVIDKILNAEKENANGIENAKIMAEKNINAARENAAIF